jgi:endonuclease/exonuclease/phosphatase family metal-dependent hydrolase
MKLLTFNLRNCTDDHWAERLPYIVERLRADPPDIAAFQEVRDPDPEEPEWSMADQIRESLGDELYPWLVTDRAMEYAGDIWEGLSIMAGCSIEESGVLPLAATSDADKNRRILQWARLGVAGGPIMLFNNHFSYDEEQALRNAEQAVEYAGAFGLPVLFVGDLNVVPDSPTARYIKDQGWSDLWALHHPGDPGYTYSTEDDTGLVKRIDYIWANAEFIARAADTRIEPAFTKRDPHTNRFASDHLGVLTAFRL